MVSTNYEKYLRKIKINQAFNNLPRYLKIRVRDALNQLNSKTFIERSISSPAYLNDLGVRKSNSPMISYKLLQKKCSVGPFALQDLLEDISSISKDSLGSFLDSYILVTGDYEAIYQAMNDLQIDFKKISDYRTLINIGSTFAAHLDHRAVNFFAQAALVTSNIEKQIVALHRQAAYLIKRSDNTTTALEKLNELINLIAKVPTNWKRQIYTALADNLYALLIVQKGLTQTNISTITYLLMNAESLVDSLPEFKKYDSNDPLIQQAGRYRSQVEMNYAQILIDSNKITQAIKVLSNNLTLVISSSPDYMAEASATLGYAYFLNGEFSKSICHLKDALQEFNRIGALSEAKVTQENLIAALYRNGSVNEANKLFETLAE